MEWNMEMYNVIKTVTVEEMNGYFKYQSLKVYYFSGGRSTLIQDWNWNQIRRLTILRLIYCTHWFAVVMPFAAAAVSQDNHVICWRFWGLYYFTYRVLQSLNNSDWEELTVIHDEGHDNASYRFPLAVVDSTLWYSFRIVANREEYGKLVDGIPSPASEPIQLNDLCAGNHISQVFIHSIFVSNKLFIHLPLLTGSSEVSLNQELWSSSPNSIFM